MQKETFGYPFLFLTCYRDDFFSWVWEAVYCWMMQFLPSQACFPDGRAEDFTAVVVAAVCFPCLTNGTGKRRPGALLLGKHPAVPGYRGRFLAVRAVFTNTTAISCLPHRKTLWATRNLCLLEVFMRSAKLCFFGPLKTHVFSLKRSLQRTKKEWGLWSGFVLYNDVFIYLLFPPPLSFLFFIPPLKG